MPGIILQLEIKAHTCHCTRLQILVVGIIFMLIQHNIRQITKITTFYFFPENTLKLTSFFAFKPYFIHFSIFYYATVSLPDSVIVFGGWNGRSDLSTVAEFSATDASWSKLGDLQQPRHGHSAITNGKTVLVIGGSGKL